MNKELKSFRVLKPIEYSGNSYGDYGYEVEGKKSVNSYVSRSGAEKAMHRYLERVGYYK